MKTCIARNKPFFKGIGAICPRDNTTDIRCLCDEGQQGKVILTSIVLK